MDIRLHRADHDHRCLHPSARTFLVNDIWRCPECGQRWRAQLGPYNGMDLTPISVWQMWLGL